MSLFTTYRCCNDATTESFLFLGYIDQVKQMSEKDDRLKIINEVLNGIKVKWHEIRNGKSACEFFISAPRFY